MSVVGCEHCAGVRGNEKCTRVRLWGDDQKERAKIEVVKVNCREDPKESLSLGMKRVSLGGERPGVGWALGKSKAPLTSTRGIGGIKVVRRKTNMAPAKEKIKFEYTCAKVRPMKEDLEENNIPGRGRWKGLGC